MFNVVVSNDIDSTKPLLLSLETRQLHQQIGHDHCRMEWIASKKVQGSKVKERTGNCDVLVGCVVDAMPGPGRYVNGIAFLDRMNEPRNVIKVGRHAVNIGSAVWRCSGLDMQRILGGNQGYPFFSLQLYQDVSNWFAMHVSSGLFFGRARVVVLFLVVGLSDKEWNNSDWREQPIEETTDHGGGKVVSKELCNNVIRCHFIHQLWILMSQELAANFVRQGFRANVGNNIGYSPFRIWHQCAGTAHIGKVGNHHILLQESFQRQPSVLRGQLFLGPHVSQ